jgi:sec-independent protein translocase protein TatA
MGFSGFSLGHLLVVLVIVVLVFGTKRLKTLGSDLGSAIKGFKNAVSEEKTEAAAEDAKRVSAETASVTPGHNEASKAADPVKTDVK